MKKNSIARLMLICFIGLILSACKPDAHHGQSASHEHLDDTLSHELAHLLGSVNSYVVSDMPIVSARYGIKTVPIEIAGRITYDDRGFTSVSSRIAGRIERIHVQYNYQPVKKGMPLLEIYAPELVTAQRELLLLLGQAQQEHLVERAKQKLFLLGMSQNQIAQLIKTKKVSYNIVLYSPTTGYIKEKTQAATPNMASSALRGTENSGSTMDEMISNSSMSTAAILPQTQPTSLLLREGQYLAAGQNMFEIYTNTRLVAAFVISRELSQRLSKGQPLLFHTETEPSKTYMGTIGLIAPKYTEGINFALFKVYLGKAPLEIGQLVKGTLALSTDEGWWLPREALLDLGAEQAVFKKEGKGFAAKKVKVLFTTDDWVQIKDDISDWQIATNAQYLVDSESFVDFKNKS
ncbi:efflux RND transporter periplasmic adaptor subunit [Olivibacter sitiensis]|uniref:efflux RND transporter periplasmic adaptor subunit n=1 Tax=Olivibacter sitiensis TaxID=376470 RepID=UPI000405EF2A|nr:efflux RND transporter periplasmic adaptor subunit [Olivibacter sitiensis]